MPDPQKHVTISSSDILPRAKLNQLEGVQLPISTSDEVTKSNGIKFASEGRSICHPEEGTRSSVQGAESILIGRNVSTIRARS